MRQLISDLVSIVVWRLAEEIVDGTDYRPVLVAVVPPFWGGQPTRYYMFQSLVLSSNGYVVYATKFHHFQYLCQSGAVLLL